MIRVAEPDDEIPKINPSEVETLIKKIEQTTLSEQDKRMIVRLLRTLLRVVSMLQEKKITLLRLKAMIFGQKSEKMKRGDGEKGEVKDGPGSGVQEGGKGDGSQTPKNEKLEGAEGDNSGRKPGHGRHRASDYPGARKVHCRHQQLVSGSPCPKRDCRGKVYRERPHQFIQFTGQPAIQATQYEQEVVRCRECGGVYEAPLPEGVSPKKWDETADAAIAIERHAKYTPSHRTAKMQEMCGIPLPESVQSERCREVADVLGPIYERMKKEAANGKVFQIDDTPVRIMELVKENKEKKKGKTEEEKKEEEKKEPEQKEEGKEKVKEKKRKRKKKKQERVAIQTSGVVVELQSGAKVALYFNGRRHAGENVEDIYQLRDPGLGLPVQMSDALACNFCGERERIVCKCLVHARRKFVEIGRIYPEACTYVLEQIGEIYRNEKQTAGMSDEERLAYHQKHSGPVMAELKQWMDEQMAEKKVEPNSSLGKAIDYFQTHDEGLSAYLRYAGAPLDNNACEQVLRPVAIMRKNSYGYKTKCGAKTAAIIQSVIQTCRLNGANVWQYLVSVLRRSAEVREKPEAFLPWNYKGEEERVKVPPLAA
jgi:transposase